MERSNANRPRDVRRWLVNASRTACVVTVIAIAATWAGATYDHPIDDAIVAGMQSPNCTAVRTMKAGSLLTSMLPDEGICRAFFLYRGSVSNAPDSEDAYRVSVAQGRLDEFQQLFAYVWLVAMAAAGAGYALFVAGRGIWHRLLDRYEPAIVKRSDLRART